MQCFRCKCPDSHVVSTWPDIKRNSIKRSRECMNCKMHFSTEEKLREPRTKSNDITSRIE